MVSVSCWAAARKRTLRSAIFSDCARAFFGRDTDAFAGLGPALWFFHRLIVAHDPVLGRRVFTPWQAGSAGAILLVMQIPKNVGKGAGAARDAVRGGETEEALFGDSRWVDDRLQALHAEPEREA